MDLAKRAHWIFDMDGTLTVAAHDFDAIRAELGLPAGRPILEALGALPPAESEPLWRRLDALELDLARRARPAPGAGELLETLRGRGARLGILTRNGFENSRVTLESAGLAAFFAADDLVAREHAAPKPRPDGIHRLLLRWQAQPGDAVIVGDYRFDLMAGRAAGVATVYVDLDGSREFAEHADLRVNGLAELVARLAQPG
jgi:HAD superfamily hydrolase (TIGR01509 family)